MLATYQINLKQLIEQLDIQIINPLERTPTLCGSTITRCVFNDKEHPSIEFVFGQFIWFTLLQSKPEPRYQLCDYGNKVVLEDQDQFVAMPDRENPRIVNKDGYELALHPDVLELLIQHSTPLTELEFHHEGDATNTFDDES